MYVFIKLSLSLVSFCLMYFILSQAVNIGLNPKEIRDEIPAVNLTKNFASRRQSWRDSRKIAPRFLPPWICFSARNLARFAVGFQRDFSSRDYSQLPGENLGELRGRIARKFWQPVFLLPGKNLGEIQRTIPARFPPGRKIPAAKIPPDFGRVPPRSRSLFYQGRD